MRRILFVLVIALSAASAFGAEKTSKSETKRLLFTGNAGVDFFASASPSHVAREWNFTQPTVAEKSGGSKSPWLAAGLSFLVPGAGEVYDGSYLKAGIFATVEIAAVVLGLTYDKKGNDQEAFYRGWADQHYSAAKYARWTMDNINLLNPNLTNASGYVIFTGPDAASRSSVPPYNNMRWQELNRMESDVMKTPTGQFNGYTHVMPLYGSQQYYELIGKYPQFSTGWDDADTSAFAGGTIGIRSKHFTQYMDMQVEAENYYDVARTYVGIVIVNHILSAVDAYWTASRHNHALHASVDMKIQRTQFGYQPVPMAHVTYNF